MQLYNLLNKTNADASVEDWAAVLKNLVDKSENEMMKIRNLGKKSLKEVMDKVKDMGLSFRLED